MAAIAGRHGLVKWAAKQVFRIDHWDMTAQGDMLDVTSFSTDGTSWRSSIPGLKSWSGTFSGFADSVGDSSGQRAVQAAMLLGTTGDIKLYFNETGGELYTGAVYISAMGHNVDVADSEKVTFSFTGTGALSYSTAG